MARTGHRDGRALRAAVERDYAAYANGDKKEWLKDVGSWGYSVSLMRETGLDSSLFDKIFAAACGGGCPLMLADGKPPCQGEVVVDLGCGAGHDCLLASKMVGPSGKVIGVDCTQEMLQRAEATVAEFGGKAEFMRAALDDGSSLAGVVAANSADLCISNGVFNLTIDKLAAFRSAFRVLKPGGRLQLCDVCKVPPKAAAPCEQVWQPKPPPTIGDGWTDWVSGCESRDIYVALLEQAGFEGICVSGPTNFATSPTTLGFNFVATKPLSLDALARASQPDDGSRGSFLAAAAAILIGAVGIGVAMALLRRRS